MQYGLHVEVIDSLPIPTSIFAGNPEMCHIYDELKNQVETSADGPNLL